jgi:hypothetical protein
MFCAGLAVLGMVVSPAPLNVPKFWKQAVFITCGICITDGGLFLPGATIRFFDFFFARGKLEGLRGENSQTRDT